MVIVETPKSEMYISNLIVKVVLSKVEV